MQSNSLILTTEGYQVVSNLNSNTLFGTDKRAFNKDSLHKDKQPVDIIDSNYSITVINEPIIQIETIDGFKVGLNPQCNVILESANFKQEVVKVKYLGPGLDIMLQSGRGLFPKTSSTFNQGLIAGTICAGFQLQALQAKAGTWDIDELVALKKSTIHDDLVEIGKKIFTEHSIKDMPPIRRVIMYGYVNYGRFLGNNNYVPLYGESDLFIDGFLSAIFSLLGVYTNNELEDSRLNENHLICSNDVDFLHHIQLLLLNMGLLSSKIDIESSNQIALSEKLYVDAKISKALKIDRRSQHYIYKELSQPDVKKLRYFRLDMRSRVHTSKIKKIEMVDFDDCYVIKGIKKPLIVNGFNVYME